MNPKYFISLTLIIVFFSCELVRKDENSRLNFIIFIADDISWDDFGCYGNKFVQTPNIDQLSKEGMIFKNMYLTTSSCSPSRNSIITGRYPHNTGAPELHSEPPMEMKTFIKELKNNGYFTVSSGKFHLGQYARSSFDIIHENKKETGLGGESKWISTIENRPMDKPFFLWYASHDAHRDWEYNEFSGTHIPNTIVPPNYLVNDEPTRKDLANYFDEIKRFDFSIGKVIETLKKQKIYDNTMIIVMADNGRPFPHSKTRLNDQGVKTPFIVVNNKLNVKGVTKSLVSSIDIAPTILELANQKKGPTYQGRSFKKILLNPDTPFRNYVFAEHNWHDFESYERMVRSEQFMYIENKRNHFAQRGPLDAINSDSYASLLQLFDYGGISEIQKDIFISPREKEEFYKMDTDIFQRENLIHDDAFGFEIDQLKNILEQWKTETGDTEPEQITKDWYERRPGPKAKIKEVENNVPKGGKYSLTTSFYGKRGEFPGASKNASKINNKGPF